MFFFTHFIFFVFFQSFLLICYFFNSIWTNLKKLINNDFINLTFGQKFFVIFKLKGRPVVLKVLSILFGVMIGCFLFSIVLQFKVPTLLYKSVKQFWNNYKNTCSIALLHYFFKQFLFLFLCILFTSFLFALFWSYFNAVLVIIFFTIGYPKAARETLTSFREVLENVTNKIWFEYILKPIIYFCFWIISVFSMLFFLYLYLQLHLYVEHYISGLYLNFVFTV